MFRNLHCPSCFSTCSSKIFLACYRSKHIYRTCYKGVFFFVFKTSTRTLKLPAINLLKQKKKTEKWNSILNCIQTVHVAVTRHSQKVKRLLILSSPSLMATSLSFDIRQCKLSCQHITTLYKGDMTMNKYRKLQSMSAK